MNDNCELALKASLIVNDLKVLQHTISDVRAVITEAAVELQKLRQENDLLRARLRVADIKLGHRADFDASADEQPSFLRPQAG